MMYIMEDNSKSFFYSWDFNFDSLDYHYCDQEPLQKFLSSTFR